jgi:NAD(P)-dependent dehydrogenase (short-subunit alcohol dehydrogenase family)
MNGKTVLITGATSGIGKATAFGLAAMGAQLAITGRNPDRTEAVAHEISAVHGGTVNFYVADLSAQNQVRRLAHEVLQQLPQIDVLINNAGGCWDTRHVTADGLERTFAVNHLAPFLLTLLLLNRLKAVGTPESSPSHPTPKPSAGSTSPTSKEPAPTPAPAPTTSPSSPT